MGFLKVKAKEALHYFQKKLGVGK